MWAGSAAGPRAGRTLGRPWRSGRWQGHLAAPLGLATLSALASLACVRELPPERVDDSSRPVAVWELPGEPPGKSSVTLWPRAAGTPERKKRQVATESIDGHLEARVAGPDPCFLWQLATPVHAAVFRVDVRAQDEGRLQLFWSTKTCPVFSEVCSASVSLQRGQNVVAFVLDTSTPIRELRLDLPEVAGARLVFTSIGFSPEPALDTAWVGRDTTQVAVDPGGLTLTTSEPDPWLVVATPGLDAARVEGVEITLRGPSGPPQLFWDGTCEGFAEACSVILAPADAGASTHSARIASREWRGPIRQLRLDPGPGPGEYRIERIALLPRRAP